MSKAPWKRCPITGLPVRQIPEEYLTASGEFDVSSFPGCNLFDDRSIAAEAGFGMRVDNWKARGLAPCSSYWHLIPIVDDGAVLTYATHTNSAQAGGLAYRKDAKARQLTGKRKAGGTNISAADFLETVALPAAIADQFLINVTSGSNSPPTTPEGE